jgi:imidazolonepropionase-like amidohydrolase
VTAHAHALTSIADAVAAGVDGLEHVSFWTADGVHAPGYHADILAVDGDPVADPEALHRIRAVYARGVDVPGPAGGGR